MAKALVELGEFGSAASALGSAIQMQPTDRELAQELQVRDRSKRIEDYTVQCAVVRSAN
jgi:hypothetical protein